MPLDPEVRQGLAHSLEEIRDDLDLTPEDEAFEILMLYSEYISTWVADLVARIGKEEYNRRVAEYFAKRRGDAEVN